MNQKASEQTRTIPLKNSKLCANKTLKQNYDRKTVYIETSHKFEDINEDVQCSDPNEQPLHGDLHSAPST